MQKYLVLIKRVICYMYGPSKIGLFSPWTSVKETGTSDINPGYQQCLVFNSLVGKEQKGAYTNMADKK